MDIKNFIYIVKHIDLFDSFSSQELLQLFKKEHYEIKEYKKSSIIYLQNQRCSTLDIILKGNIIVQKIDSNGNILTISSFGPGEIIGGNLIFANNNIYPMTIASKTSSTILHVKKDLILELCQMNKSFLVMFLQSISDKTLILTNKIKSITMKTIRQCIIDFLAYEYYIQKDLKIVLGISKKELAERIGVQRPSLLRELRKMRADGLIEYDAQSITIRGIELIRKFT
jgi:CRP/FNR family transcriptional regulator, dissimilatory nitrate respiration regulator